MSHQDLRREPRVDIELDVTLQTPDGERHYFAGDASYRGIFLITSDPIPLRRLVRMRADIDDGHDAPLEMMGIVAHHLDSGDAQRTDHQPGMGIHLFAAGSQPLERWHDYLNRHYEADPETRAAHRRLNMPHLVVHLSNREDLADAFDDAMETGSMKVRNNRVPAAGSQVLCDFVTSEDGPALTLQATVDEAVRTPPRDRGVHLRFADLDDADRERIDAFVAGELEADGSEADTTSITDAMPDIPADA